MNTNLLDLENLLRIPYVDSELGFHINDDGLNIAFSWNLTGRWEIYVLNLKEIHDNQKSGKTQKITGGVGAKFAPRWRPHKNQLSYVLDLDGSENYDIYLYDFESHQHTNLTPETLFAISPLYSWSPDGNSLAFCSNQDGQFDIYILSISDQSIRKVLNRSYVDWEVDWSPSGKYLAVVSEAIGQDTYLTIVPVQVDEPDQIHISIGGKPINAKDPCWSPDGKNLAFASNYHGNYQIGVYNLDSEEINWVTSGEGEKEKPDWSSNEELAYVVCRGPTCELAILNLSTTQNEFIKHIPGVIYSPIFVPSGTHLFFVFENPQHPCDLWSLHLQENKCQQITDSIMGKVEQSDLVIPEEIWYPGLDGVPVPALLYRPDFETNSYSKRNGKKQANSLPPAVIAIHGGPNWLSQITWDPFIQHMVNRGWVVLAPNYRGSTGYGREWQFANRFDLGGVDTQDVVAGVVYLEAEKIADPKKIAVTGRSWGGYLTMMCLTQYPDKWITGSAVVPFLNWFSAHINSRVDLQHWDIQNFGDPVVNQDLWYKRSPFFYLDKVKTPVQLICGIQDVRCPASESRDAYNKLNQLGIECEYILYEDEGHSFLNVENRVKSRLQQVKFLSKHLER